MTKKIQLFLTAIFSLFVLTGCNFGLNSVNLNALSGVVVSEDYGENWNMQNKWLVGDKTNSLFSINTREFIFDKQDPNLIYLASRNSGIFESEDSGVTWEKIFSKKNVNSLALDPVSRGVVYAAEGNKIYKTIDLGQNWTVVYEDSRSNVAVTALAVDPDKNKKVVIGTSKGDVFISFDGGESWSPPKADVTSRIRKIIINEDDSDKIYFATMEKGIFKSEDGGETWVNLYDNYRKIDYITKKYRFMIPDYSVKDGLLVVTRYGIIRTQDGGKNWTLVDTVTPSKSSLINGLTMNRENTDHIYYATQNVLYKTFDGGESWLSTKLDISKQVSYLILDPSKENVLFLGVFEPEEQAFYEVQTY
jgi:photosystem II stability/assembly factor-like uncharacterized protein